MGLSIYGGFIDSSFAILARLHPQIPELLYLILHNASLWLVNRDNYADALFMIALGGILVHVVEAFYVLAVAVKRNVNDKDTTWWVISVVLLGFPQTTIFLSAVDKKNNKKN